MKLSLSVIALAVFAIIVADPAVARARHHFKPRCGDQPVTSSWYGIVMNPKPQPNGCAPPVYQYGRYVGQDPDPFIRSQLLRDPATGYSSEFSR